MIGDIISKIDGFIWGWPMIILLFGTHIFMTFRTGFIQKDIFLVKSLCVLAAGMTAIMFFSPGFPPRSGFPGTVFLIIAAGILLRIQEEFGIELVLPNAKKFLLCVSLLYFFMTAAVTMSCFYNIHIYMTDLINSAKQHSIEKPEKILQVKPMEEVNQEICSEVPILVGRQRKNHADCGY